MIILAGLVWAVTAVFRLLAAERSRRDQAVRITAQFWAPHLLVVAGFWLSRSVSSFWTLVVYTGVVLLTRLVLRLVRRPGGGEVDRAAAAVVLAAGVLLEFGSMFLVRVAVSPDLASGSVLNRRELAEGFSVVIVPMGGVALLIGVAWLLRRLAGKEDLARALLRHRKAPLFAMAATVVLFALPLVGAPGSAMFAGVATSEWSKLALLAVVAWLVTSHDLRFDAVAPPGQGPRMAVWRGRNRRVLMPSGLLLLCGAYVVLSGRNPGALAAIAAGILGIVWADWRFATRARPVVAAIGFLPRIRTAIRRSRRVLLTMYVVALLGLTAPLLAVDGAGERMRIWQDPWAYRWDSGCVVVDGAGALPVSPGAVVCQRSLVADLESARSQTARGLAAIADGGLWGRGLSDTTSSLVPAQSTDYVLAGQWSKLGGLVVVVVAILVVLLGLALARAGAASTGRTSSTPGVAALFAAGVGAMIAGEYLYAFAGTVNVVPYFGVPVPFMSRAGQANLVLLAGVAAVLAVARSRPVPQVADAARVHAPRVAAGTGRVVVVQAAVMLAVLLVVVTAAPYVAPRAGSGFWPTVYDEDRPPCPKRSLTREGLTTPPPDPAVCSTDTIPQLRTRVEVRLAGGTVLVRQPDGTWLLTGTADGSGLTPPDLGGLLQIGASPALLDRAYPDVVFGSAGGSLRRRLLPSPRLASPDGLLALTVDPYLQHTASASLRASDPAGGPPLAGGVVALNVDTGEVLAAASAPSELPLDRETPDLAALERLTLDRRYYATLQPDGSLDGSTFDSSCRQAPEDCWVWSVRAATKSDGQDLRQYVGGDPTAELPSPSVNRAVSKSYGLGTAFKFVIAAAYLQQPGTSADDLVAAPEEVHTASAWVIGNPGGGACQHTVDGRVSVRDALRGGCVTAFVLLAQQLGWSRLSEQARRFGMQVEQCRDTTAWLNGVTTGTTGSCVPPTVDPDGVARVAAAGGVVGTPLGLATMVAAVANDGLAKQPTLVAALQRPGRQREQTAPGDERTAMSTAAAAQLQAAMLPKPDGLPHKPTPRGSGQRWQLTGTYDVVLAFLAPDSSQFVRHIVWLAGVIDTPRGEVAFATAVESHDERAGVARAQFVIDALCRAAMKQR